MFVSTLISSYSRLDSRRAPHCLVSSPTGRQSRNNVSFSPTILLPTDPTAIPIPSQSLAIFPSHFLLSIPPGAIAYVCAHFYVCVCINFSVHVCVYICVCVCVYHLTTLAAQKQTLLKTESKIRGLLIYAPKMSFANSLKCMYT